MAWVDLILLVIVVLIIDNGLKAIAKEFDEKDTQYNIRFLKIEEQIAKIENK